MACGSELPVATSKPVESGGGWSLGANQLSGPIPSELGGLSNLKSLSPRWITTSFRVAIPSELGGLSNLESAVPLGYPAFGCDSVGAGGPVESEDACTSVGVSFRARFRRSWGACRIWRWL